MELLIKNRFGSDFLTEMGLQKHLRNGLVDIGLGVWDS